MRFPPTFLDSIRARVPISEVVGQRVTWDKRKSQPQRGDFWACCPFHGEKTPSFHADDRRGRYHCFGCGVSGDHFTFLVEQDGMSFPQAVEQLAGADEDILGILAKMIRQRQESATIYEENGRLEMAAQEREEIEVIRGFLPEQLCDEDIEAACRKAIDTVGAQGLRDMGKCMGALKKRYAGQMDFGKASSLVKEILK